MLCVWGVFHRILQYRTFLLGLEMPMEGKQQGKQLKVFQDDQWEDGDGRLGESNFQWKLILGRLNGSICRTSTTIQRSFIHQLLQTRPGFSLASSLGMQSAPISQMASTPMKDVLVAALSVVQGRRVSHENLFFLTWAVGSEFVVED